MTNATRDRLAPLRRFLDWNAAFLSGARGFYVVVVGLAVFLAVARGALFPGAMTDDAEQLYFTQGFRWGYDAANPPLYTWLVMAAAGLFGPGMMAVASVKFAAYGLAFHFLFLAARRVLGDDRLALLAALSPVAFYYVAWDAVFGYSHTVLVFCFYALTLLVFLRLAESGRVLDYALFGLAVGLGGLSKYVFFLFLLALLAAAASDRTTRSRLFDVRILLSLGIAAAVLMPHGLWLAEQSETLLATGAARFQTAAPEGGAFGGMLKGLGSAAGAAAGFLSPLWLIAAIVFRADIGHRWKGPAAGDAARKLLARFLLAFAILVVAAVVAFGVTKVRTHYMFALTLAPILFFAWLAPRPEAETRLKVFAACLSAFIGLVVVGVVVKYVSEPLRCKRCQLLVPYEDIADDLRKAGFRKGTIFAYYFPHDLAGNLRAAFPDQRVVSTKFPDAAPPPPADTGQCLLVWMPKPGGVMDARGMVQLSNKFLKSGLPWPYDGEIRELPFVFDRTAGKGGKLHYILVDDGAGECR